MKGILYTLFLNIAVIPWISLVLLNVIPTGEWRLFQIFSLLLLFILNFFFVKNIKFKFRKPQFLQYVLIIIGLIASYVIIERFILQPLGGSWDAYGMWNSKSRDYAMAFIRGDEFQMIYSDWVNPGYPVFIPLSISFFQINYGAWTKEIVLIYHYIYFLAYFLLFWILIEGQKKIFPTLLFMIFGFISLPVLASASNQIADFPIAVTFGFCILLLSNIDNSLKMLDELKLLDLFLFIIILLSCLLIKEEGLLMLMSIGLYILLFSGLKYQTKFYYILIPLIILYFSAWGFYKINSPVVMQFSVSFSEVISRFLETDRYFTIFKFLLFVEYLVLFFDIIALTWCFIIYRKNLPLLIIPVVLLLLYLAVLMITSFEHSWHVRTALGRLHTQYFQILMIIMVIIHKKK